MSARSKPLADHSQIPTIRWAQGQREIKSPVDKNILIAVATLLDVDGEDCPSVAALAGHTCFNERTVRLAINRLEQQGFLRRGVRTAPKGGRLSNRLTLVLDRPARTGVDQ